MVQQSRAAPCDGGQRASYERGLAVAEPPSTVAAVGKPGKGVRSAIKIRENGLPSSAFASASVASGFAFVLELEDPCRQRVAVRRLLQGKPSAPRPVAASSVAEQVAAAGT